MAKVKWIADPAHSEITFKVKHLMITNVTGRFTDFKVEAETADDQFNDPMIVFSADLSSITTGNEQRDAHLRSSDFFDAENHPQIQFKSREFRKKAEGEYILTGELSIRGVSKSVDLNVESSGIIVDGYGQTKAGFTVTGKINRKDFGLEWNSVTEAGGIVVSDEVKITCEVQLVKQ